jgi:hypothetical protein
MPNPSSRIGFCYYPDDRHYTQKDLDAWLPVLQSLQAGWLILAGSAAKAVPEGFVRGLIEAGIEAVIRIPAPVRPIRTADIEPLLRSYGRWGVRFVSVFEKPNLRSAWASPEGWSRSGLVDRFIDICLPIWQAQRSAGLRPVFPALEPGGDYWDTAFLEASLDRIARRGQSGLLADLTLGVFGWTFGHPLDWGAGGPGKWPESRPYHTPEGAQDQRGFRIFEWYQAVAQRAGAPNMPMIVLAGGALPGESSGDASGGAHAEANASIGRVLLDGTIPEYVQNFAYYVLATEPGDVSAAAAWFDAPATPRPPANALRALVAAQTPKSIPGARSRIPHFVLLSPEFRNWSALAEFAFAFRPTLGFSESDAAQAEHVTLVGDAGPWATEVEARLRSCGCSVQRLAVNSLPASSHQPPARSGILGRALPELQQRQSEVEAQEPSERASRPIADGRQPIAAPSAPAPRSGRKRGLRSILNGVFNV